MKNRLQIRYHIPESLPTRAQAMMYLKETFAIGRTNSVNASLPAEPLVLLYNDTQLDIANGITEAKRLETANVLLAIGRGGDGVNIFNNQDYFVIDFAKHEEDITELTSNIDNIRDIIKEVNDTIAEMQAAIAKNANDIAEIIKKIGEKGDNSLKDTVYGFIQGAYDEIDAEVNRAGDAEKELQHNIDMVNAAVATEKERALQAESDLQSHINTEEAARIDGDNDNRSAIEAETLRATNAETELRTNLQAEVDRAEGEEARIEGLLTDEIARATAKEGELNAKIDDTNANLLQEVNRALLAEQALEDAIKSEETARRDNDNALQGQITTLNQALQAESTERETQDLLLSQRIDENAKQIKENKVSSNRKTITITGPTENGTNIDVNIDNKTIIANESGTLSVSSDALVQYDGTNAIQVSEVSGGVKTISLSINPNDNILTNDVSGLLATLSLKWNHADATGQKDEIQLIGKNGVVLSRIDVADFIKDGILDNVVLNTSDANNPYLSFTFNSAAGKETINVPVKDLVEIYFAGNGLELNENTFSIKIDNSSEVFLTVSNDGLRLSGIQTAIDNAKLEVQSVITNEVEVLTTAISNLTNDLNDEINNRLTADNKIESEYKSADNVVRSEFKTADDIVRSDFALADSQLRTELTGVITNLETAYKDADKAIEDAYKQADNAINLQIATINGNIESLSTKADGILPLAQQYTDEKVSELVAANALVEQELRTNIENNEKEITKLTGDVNVDGSVKDILFDSALGAVVNTITVENATEQSLVKKFTNEGKPYVYVSNDTSDMKHNGNALNNILNEMRSDVDDVMTATTELKEQLAAVSLKVDSHDAKLTEFETRIEANEQAIEKLNEDLQALQTQITQTITQELAKINGLITSLQTGLTQAQTDITKLQETAITKIEGVANEIKVDILENSATIGFAEDAYFIAG
jgi:chromosome segregation ATPase